MTSTTKHLSRARTRTTLVANEYLACSADGCGRQRYGFSHLCASHIPRYRLHGHPSARPVHRKGSSAGTLP